MVSSATIIPHERSAWAAQKEQGLGAAPSLDLPRHVLTTDPTRRRPLAHAWVVTSPRHTPGDQ